MVGTARQRWKDVNLSAEKVTNQIHTVDSVSIRKNLAGSGARGRDCVSTLLGDFLVMVQ